MSQPGRYECRKCGGVGSIPAHRQDCPAHDAGNLSISSAVRRARGFLAKADATYAPEAAHAGAGELRIDLQAAIEAVREVLRMIDAAAIGALI